MISKNGRITVAIHDEERDRPVAKSLVRFYIYSDELAKWNQFAVLNTNLDGRTKEMPANSCAPGLYRISCFVGAYYDLVIGTDSVFDVIQYDFKLHQPSDRTAIELRIRNSGYSIDLT